MHDVTTPQDLDALLAAPSAVLLKHGASCPISAAARKAVQAFEADHPEVAVHAIEVTGHRELSGLVADRLGIAHESPQLFVLRDGRPAWQATHFDITAAALAEHVPG